jgi:hypothetical protein
MVLTGEYDVQKAIKAQADYCEKTGSPHFAPKSGICWACGKNIYEPLGRKSGQLASRIGRTGYRRVDICPFDEADYITGITVGKATTELATGCPHCNRSYCD